tara:strand:- start:2387 stop:2656 length:270 start_codon:yes stop_codon:yes gene_type:complete
MGYNNKLKLDTTMLQSNTAHHLVQFIQLQRDTIKRLLAHYDAKSDTGLKVKDINIRDLDDNFEYIVNKHLDAVHKRMGTNIFNKNDDDE